MPAPTLHLLTYLAQVRQVPSKNAWLRIRPAYITRLSLLTPQPINHGRSRKEIATIGIVRDAAWVGLNRNTGVWLRVVGNWRYAAHYFLSQSPVEERK